MVSLILAVSHVPLPCVLAGLGEKLDGDPHVRSGALGSSGIQLDMVKPHSAPPPPPPPGVLRPLFLLYVRMGHMYMGWKGKPSSHPHLLRA